MRNLRENLQVVFFRLFEGEEELKDQYGNSTSSMLPVYGELKSAMLCVSPNKGTSETEQFGSLEQYDRTMTTADTTCPIEEDTVLWVDGADTDDAWNYVVKQVAPWKNSISYAIAQVSVSEYKQVQKQIEMAQKLKQINAEGNENEDHVEPKEPTVRASGTGTGEEVPRGAGA